MSEVFRKVYPNVKYTAEIARRKFLQMPLVNIVIGNVSSGRACSYLIESQPGMDYTSVYHLLTDAVRKQTNETTSGMSKATFKTVMSLACSDRERELIRVTTFISGRFSQTSARRQLGLENMKRRTDELERCAMKVKEIKESIEEIAESEICASAITHKAGLNLSSSGDSSGSDDFIDEEETKETVVLCSEIEKDMVDTLKLSCFWNQKNQKCTKLMLDSFYSCLSKYEFTERELVLTQQSYLAFKSDEYMYSRDRNQMERLLNGDVVTDSETDNDSEYYNGDRGDVIKKKVQSIRRRTKRRIAKGIAERKFLHRSYSKRANCIVDKYPDIGDSIEQFV